MWKHILPDSSNDWEPLELRVLKRRLANITCECHVCKSSELNLNRRLLDKQHKEVQAELQNESFDRFTQARTNIFRNGNNCFLHEDKVCPSCFFTLNLLRGVATKVMKDEESETKTEVLSRDKSTGKRLIFVEKTTSITNKPVLKYSNFSFYDNMSEYSSDFRHTEKMKSNHDRERVTFLDLKDDDTKEQTQSISGTCLCLDDFVNSIRPPLGNTIWG